MLGMFKAHPVESISYVKMYGSLPDERQEISFAFILMPTSSKRHLVSLQSIQFVFNAQGHVTKMRIIYSGCESEIHKKLQETMSELVSLKLRHERRDTLCTYHDGRRMFESCFTGAGEAHAYLGDIVDFLKVSYLINNDYAQEIKSQLLNKDYLTGEFIRLRGGVSEPTHSCTMSCTIL